VRALGVPIPVILGLLLAGEARGGEKPAPVPLRGEQGDVELLSRIAEKNGVETRPPRSGVLDYVSYLVEKAVEWGVGMLKPLGRYTEGMGPFLEAAARALAFLAGALLLYVSGRWLARRRRGSGPSEPAPLPAGDTRPALFMWDEAVWRRELEKRLGSSDVAGALEALWWWLARSVEGLRVSDSWTSGDLLASARRPGLRNPLRRLERMMYGSRKPSVDEVRELLRSLEQQLA
jgi:hypothetical protein